jgi:hypothetical protein
MNKSLIAGILACLLLSTPTFSHAQSVERSLLSEAAVQQLITLYTKLIQILEQELMQLTSTNQNQASSSPIFFCPHTAQPISECLGVWEPRTSLAGCTAYWQCVPNAPDTALPAATIDDRWLSTSGNIYLEGSAKNIPYIGVVILDSEARKVYDSGIMPVTHNSWTINDQTVRPSGTYQILVYGYADRNVANPVSDPPGGLLTARMLTVTVVPLITSNCSTCW